MRFVFVDRIEKIEKNKYAKGIKTISFEEGFLKSPYGEKGFFPRLLLMESAAQLASWLIMYSSDFKRIPRIVKMDKFSVMENVKCGTTIRIDVRINSMSTEGALLNCDIFVGSRLIAKGENCEFMFIGLEKLANKSEMKAMFADLSSKAEFVKQEESL